MEFSAEEVVGLLDGSIDDSDDDLDFDVEDEMGPDIPGK